VASSSEEEADANEVVENSVCLFTQFWLVQVHVDILDCFIFLPNDLIIFFYYLMLAGRGKCATSRA